MNKLFALLVSLLMITGLLSGCGSGASDQETPSGTPEKAKVYLITMDQMDQHWQNVNKGAEEVAAANSDLIEYKWSAPDKKDDAQQIDKVNNAVSDGAKVILLAANGPDAISSALEEAAAKGVKIIYVDSPANFPGEATFATDNQAAGKTAGEQMLAEFKAKGITSGDIGIINVKPDTTSCVLREEGFRSAFEGTDFNILTTQFCEGDAAKSQDAAANFISQGCVGIFGTNEGGTVGVGNAIKSSGKAVTGVGFDKSDTILGLITDGALLCTMAQNPDEMGKQGMEAAIKLINGESISTKNVDTGVSVITKDSI
ncbi:MAG: periplasmic binding protein/LacI transcriptional regulator [Bacillota bacterium]|jgi:ribose transport system substrate-binding protein|nr:periplasmic binding protein/LacI transcriptional regulator [Bacillota bacterium]